MRKKALKVQVGIIMGSTSDWSTMKNAAETLDQLKITYEKKVVSAHRTPELLYQYANEASNRGLQCIISGAGGAAHLPGMTASMTQIPVLGVPIESKTLKGMDSLLSIVQMPAGIPVSTFAIGRAGAINAALTAASILSLSDTNIRATLRRYRRKQTQKVLENSDSLDSLDKQ